MAKYSLVDIHRMRNILVVVSVVALIAGFLIGNVMNRPEIQVIPATYISQASILLPAVDDQGNGLVTPLRVETRPGDGRVLTNIDKLLFWVDTQFSMQTAKIVAQLYTNVDTSKFDLIYTIESSEASIIGGPSAGAALTIATIAALQNKTLKPNVMITGTIEPDGSIGRVGGILEKAEAAKEAGATTFLVPQGESVLTYLKPEEKCSNVGGFVVCETRYNEISLDVESESGINIVEVSNIGQAVSYFL